VPSSGQYFESAACWSEGRAWVGTRDDGFYLDEKGIFDIVNLAGNLKARSDLNIDPAHVYVAGRTSRTLDGDVACPGDMRGQIREVCIGIDIALKSVGATFADITRTITYTTDMKAYFAAIDERFKYFKDPLPTSTLIGVACLAMPEMLVEIEVEAIIETERLRLPKK